MADENRKQLEEAERTGRTAEVTGRLRSFRNYEEIPMARDLQGPAGDPVEGRRPDGDNDPWPA